MFKNLLLWFEHLLGMHAAGVVIAPPPTAANPTPVIFNAPGAPVPVDNAVGDMTMVPTNAAFPPFIAAASLPAGYGSMDENGYCTVDTIESLRSEIMGKDPTYFLPAFYLCPQAIATIADTAKRVGAQWACSQVTYWSGFGEAPFYPGVIVVTTTTPGMEAAPANIISKYHTVKGQYIDPDTSKANHQVVNGMRPESMSTAGIAGMARALWIDDARKRGVKIT